MNWLIKHKSKIIIPIAVVISFYMYSTFLINAVGVPLAAYHSYEAWTTVNSKTAQELLVENDTVSNYPDLNSTNSDYKKVQKLDSISLAPSK
jgi:hypothetical protein